MSRKTNKASDKSASVVFEGFRFYESDFNSMILYDNMLLVRHRNGGGYVPLVQDADDPHQAYIAPEVYVGPRAMVLGTTKVFGGEIRGGEFYGGVIHDGYFRGGYYYGGEFHGGTYEGGHFYRGVFTNCRCYAGTFDDDEFHGGLHVEEKIHRGDCCQLQ